MSKKETNTPAKQAPAPPALRVITQASFDDLRAKLNSPPEKVKINKFAQNSLYIPVSYVEAELDNQFGAMNWQVENLTFSQIGGEVKEDKSFAYFICSLSLRILHPVTGYWVTRDGVASGQTTGKQISSFAGKLKAEALKNAAKSLGVKFGRELNRDEVYEDRVSAYDLKEIQRTVLDKMENLETIDDVLAYQRNHPDRREQWFRQMAATRVNAIKENE